MLVLSMRTNSIGLFLNNLNNWHLYEFKPWLRTAAKCSYSLQWNQSCEMKLIEAEHTVVIYADLAGYCYHSFNASCNICLLQVSWHWKWRKIMSKSDCLCTYCSVLCLAFGQQLCCIVSAHWALLQGILVFQFSLPLLLHRTTQSRLHKRRLIYHNLTKN